MERKFDWKQRRIGNEEKSGNGSVVIISIRFTALSLDSSRSNRISLKRRSFYPARSTIQSHLISFERVVHVKCIGRTTIISRECPILQLGPADKKFHCNFRRNIGHGHRS